MKTLLSILALFAVSALAQITINGSFTISGTVSSAPASSASYIIEENFEATGYDLGGWSETLNGGTIDEDYTGTVLQGSQSLRLLSGGSVTYNQKAFASSGDHFYFFFMLRYTTISDANSVFTLYRTGVDECKVQLTAGGAWQIYNGTIGTSAGATSSATTYFVWGEWQKGTGANGIARIWVSTTSTKPGSPTVEITNGDSANNVEGVSSQAWTGAEHIEDRILVDDVAIGDNP
jgi:hypothetical protein